MDKFLPEIRKTIRVFRFDPHPRKKQLAIIGESIITVFRNGKTVKEVYEPLKKSVNLLGLNQSSRTDAIVNDILQGCPFIEDCSTIRSSLKDVIEEVKKRDYDANGMAVTTRRASDGSYLPRFPDVFDDVDTQSLKKYSPEKVGDDVDVMRLNEYVEMLYEDIPKKVEGVRMISTLTKNPRYIVAVIEHASATNAIFRTLREDNRKNMNLTNHIFSICLDFARMHCFHRFLIRHKLPTLVLNILDFELERCEKWKAQLLELEQLARKENTRRVFDEYVNANDNYQNCLQIQDCILRSGFEILHYLSEDRLVNSALLHQGVTTSLTDALDRMDFSLLESVLGHLKDVSPFKEYISQIITVDTLSRLGKLLKSKMALPVKVVRACFGVLCNTSFNPALRDGMVKIGLLSVFSRCLVKSSLSDCVAKTLYIISMDTSNRTKIAKSGVPATLLSQLTQGGNSSEQISRIKGALAANLAKDFTAAEVMGECIKASVLVKNAIKTHDTLAMKIVRNIVEVGSSSSLVDQQAGHIAKAVVEVNSLDFVLECVGILASLNVDQVNFPDLLKKNRLVVWLKRQIMNYMNMTNVLGISDQLKTATLEVVILLSNICKKEDGARFIVGEGFIDQILIRLIYEPQTDPQIMQQIVYLFNVCCRHESVAAFLVTKTQFPQELMAFALQIGGELRKQCEATLHKLGEFDETWSNTMTEHEFLVYNENWANTVTEVENGSHSPQKFSKKIQTAETYQDLLERACDPYSANFQDDDEDILYRSNGSGDFLDDSTTDEESVFLPWSSRGHSGSNSVSDERSGINYSDFYELYRKEFEDEFEAFARDWQLLHQY